MSTRFKVREKSVGYRTGQLDWSPSCVLNLLCRKHKNHPVSTLLEFFFLDVQAALLVVQSILKSAD